MSMDDVMDEIKDRVEARHKDLMAKIAAGSAQSEEAVCVADASSGEV